MSTGHFDRNTPLASGANARCLCRVGLLSLAGFLLVGLAPDYAYAAGAAIETPALSLLDDGAAGPGLQPTATTVAEIEACAEQNLPGSSGVVEFGIEMLDRKGESTHSRAELQFRKPENELTRIRLVVSEPAKTAGTALLMIDRDAEDPEFYVRLPEMAKVKRIRSRRMRGPVLGTDFSYEDLDRLRNPVQKTALEILGSIALEGAPAWVLETVPKAEDRSQYSRVLTFVDEATCLPVRIELFEAGRDGTHRLRKRLAAPRDGIRPVKNSSGDALASMPHRFVMEDLERETQTIVRIESVESGSELSADLFTRSGLGASRAADSSQGKAPTAPPASPPAGTR